GGEAERGNEAQRRYVRIKPDKTAGLRLTPRWLLCRRECQNRSCSQPPALCTRFSSTEWRVGSQRLSYRAATLRWLFQISVRQTHEDSTVAAPSAAAHKINAFTPTIVAAV